MYPFLGSNMKKGNKDLVNEILKAFGEEINLQNLALNEDRSCILSVDQKHAVQLVWNEMNESLDFFTELGDLSNDELYGYLLKSNAEWPLTKGMTLAKKESQSKIILEYQLPLLNLTKALFEKAFERFIFQLDIWDQYLQSINQGNLPEELAELQ